MTVRTQLVWGKAWIPFLLIVSAIYAEEYVPGVYYYEDQGLFAEFDGGRVYSEQYNDGPAYDFGGRLVFTFDDVVFDDSLDRILDVLADHDIPAIFFLCGVHLGAVAPTEVRPRLERMLADGHEIGNHSWTHDQFDRGQYADGLEDEKEIAADLDLLEMRVNEILGRPYRFRYVRPPYGIRGNDYHRLDDRIARPGTVDRVLAERNQHLVLWHINSLDYLIVPGGEYDPTELPDLAAERVRLSRGGVVLFHANAYTASTIESTIAAIMAGGTVSTSRVRAVTLGEIYAIKYGPDGSLTQRR